VETCLGEDVEMTQKNKKKNGWQVSFKLGFKILAQKDC
jgi:hypothetical protein